MNNTAAKTLWVLLGLAIALVIIFLLVHTLTFPRIPDDLNEIALNNPTYILGDDGQIAKILADREVITLDQMSPHVVHAFIALEDHNFYSHHGINKRALLRAVIDNIIHFRVRQGGSTITQQLAKNLFFSFERDWARKIKEIFVAFQIERQFSKDQILEAYINQINFGSGVYGVELAAQTYYGKHANELTLAEAAMLAGIPRWPARYNPSINADVAKERLTFVLKRMVEEGFITENEKALALLEEIKADRINKMQGTSDYFVDEVKNQLSKTLGAEAVNYGGLRIYTTLNNKYQFEATRAVLEGLAQIDEMMGLPPYQKATWDEKLKYPQAALVAIDPATGAVKAMVGGRDFRRAPFNRAVANNRHAGSAFKPFIYMTALLKKDVSPATIYVDEEISLPTGSGSWSPDNIDYTFQGPVALKWALMRSINVVAAKLISETGPEKVVVTARNMGIESHIEPNLSLALGATGVSPLEMAVAYATIANGGTRRHPMMYTLIKNSEGEVIEETIPKFQRVVDASTSYLLLDMMRGVVERYGTGAAVRNHGLTRPCAGKTGTSSDYRDNWFVGFTPELVTAVWVGFDDNRIMRDGKRRGMTGSRSALPIWARFMRNALAQQPQSDFTIPDDISFATINIHTGSESADGDSLITVALKNQ